MKRIVEYQIEKSTFSALTQYLEGEGSFKANSYFGMPTGTIDDGKSKQFDSCARFSTFKETDEGKSITLRVEDSGLARIVDTYFAQKN